jgi:hypothetical protein
MNQFRSLSYEIIHNIAAIPAKHLPIPAHHKEHTSLQPTLFISLFTDLTSTHIIGQSGW